MEADYSFRSLVGAGPNKYFGVLKSSRPNPVTQLLERISTLRKELNHEREKHKNEQKEMRDKYEAELQLVRDARDDLGRNFQQLQERYKEDLTRTLRKVEQLDGSWTALQTRASELRSEVNAFGGFTHTDHQITPDDTLHSEGIIVDVAPKEDVGERLPEWQMERAELLHRQKAIEERLVAQESDSAWLLQETQDGLESIITGFYETTQKLVDRKTALDNFQTCQKAGVGPLQLRNTELMMKANAIIHPDALQPTCGKDMADLDDGTAAPEPTEGTKLTAAGPQNSTRDVIAEGLAVSATEKSQSAKVTPHKRTLSELLDDEREASSADYQRRRTGFASYVGLSNPAWQHGVTSTTARNGFASAHGDFQSISEVGAPFSVNDPSRQDRYNVVQGNQMAPLGKHTAPGLDFSTTKVALEISSPQSHPSVSLPLGPPKDSFRSPEVTSDSSEDERAPPRVFHFRSNTQGQSPWKVPVVPRKWQNSALRKGR